MPGGTIAEPVAASPIHVILGTPPPGSVLLSTLLAVRRPRHPRPPARPDRAGRAVLDLRSARIPRRPVRGRPWTGRPTVGTSRDVQVVDGCQHRAPPRLHALAHGLFRLRAVFSGAMPPADSGCYRSTGSCPNSLRSGQSTARPQCRCPPLTRLSLRSRGISACPSRQLCRTASWNHGSGRFAWSHTMICRWGASSAAMSRMSSNIRWTAARSSSSGRLPSPSVTSDG